MRILLDESVPGRLGTLLTGHSTITVQGRGWTSIKNGKLLALAADEFDVLLTADKGMEYQQNLATLPISILVVLARSNRIEDLAAAVPAILVALAELPPRMLRKLAASQETPSKWLDVNGLFRRVERSGPSACRVWRRVATAPAARVHGSAPRSRPGLGRCTPRPW